MLNFSRREMLRSASCGFGYLAMAGLCGSQAKAATKTSLHPLEPRSPHFASKAKRVIFMCMRGAPAHVDTFDYKPQTGSKEHAGSVFKFNQAGQSGLYISELLPELSKHADKLCVINGMHAEVPNHPQAFLQMHTGEFRFPRPSVGSWTLYGLGSENQNLPGFITINPETRVGGAQNYSSGFLPPIYQGTAIGYVGADISKATINNVTGTTSRDVQRQQLDLVQAMNREHLAAKQQDGNLEAVIESMELGFRMQSAVPELLDISRESQTTLDEYGVGKTEAVGRCLNDDFGRQCLLARRFAEAGVRYIEICHSNWDQHGNHRKELSANCKAIDQPIAALLHDLDQRGMLDETLIVWGGEFGRTPLTPSKNGDNNSGHNSAGFTFWLAGGGVKGGMSWGKTDETGRRAVENTVNFHDLHATMLHLLGLDHEKLAYHYGGRDYRLTGVEGGRIVKEILA